MASAIRYENTHSVPPKCRYVVVHDNAICLQTRMKNLCVLGLVLLCVMALSEAGRERGEGRSLLARLIEDLQEVGANMPSVLSISFDIKESLLHCSLVIDLPWVCTDTI